MDVERARTGGNVRDEAGAVQEGVGQCRGQVLCAEQGRDALGFPTWLGWQGWMSGLLCIILLYNTGTGGGRERERGNLVSFSAKLLINGTGVGIT